MTIHLRSEVDSHGDAIEHHWYCSASCYSDSFQDYDAGPGVTKDGFEEGGAYPCGAEHDSPDFCVTCGAAVGNPLTPEGEEYVREFVEEVENPNRLSCAVYYPYNNANARNNARRLRETYPYLFEGRGVAISTPDNLAPSKEG